MYCYCYQSNSGVAFTIISGSSASLTLVDHARIACAVVANVKEASMSILAGFMSEIEMIKALEGANGNSRIKEQIDL